MKGAFGSREPGIEHEKVCATGDASVQAPTPRGWRCAGVKLPRITSGGNSHSILEPSKFWVRQAQLLPSQRSTKHSAWSFAAPAPVDFTPVAILLRIDDADGCFRTNSNAARACTSAEQILRSGTRCQSTIP